MTLARSAASLVAGRGFDQTAPGLCTRAIAAFAIVSHESSREDLDRWPQHPNRCTPYRGC